MSWEVIKENQREYADESYFLKAQAECPEGNLILEVVWAQIMYAVTVELIPNNSEPKLVYDCMVFYEDRIEKYAHQIMRITQKSPLERLRRLDGFQKDGVLNHNLSAMFGVTYKSSLPEKINAQQTVQQRRPTVLRFAYGFAIICSTPHGWARVNGALCDKVKF